VKALLACWLIAIAALVWMAIPWLTSARSAIAPPLIQPGKVEGFQKVEHERNFKKHKRRDEKVAHRRTQNSTTIQT
jgi:hypothetical protein